MILKCKMCGGDLGEAVNGIATCKYCGTTQTVPKTLTERKQQLYDRAEHYRSTNEFDRAFSLYEQILIEDDSDAEVYWDMVLCRYGIEYVEDPKTHERIPTVNRVQYKSIFDDANYLMALEKASDEQKLVLSAEAKRIDAIQSGILEIANKEKPYDIFICYKETDDRGNRTLDSVLAQDMYDKLMKEGYKVFFSRITLEDKIGTAYEPYIFAALNSAKIMIAVGTSAANYNAVWVKNEWSRYLGLIRAGEKKTLIPAYRDMDPYDLPEEFAHLQAQDMGKLGFMQDLIRGIKKLINVSSVEVTHSGTEADVATYKKRALDCLNDGEFDKAKRFCEKVLNLNPEDAEAYCIRLCAEMQVKNQADLAGVDHSFENASSYQNILQYGSEELKNEISGYLECVKANEEIKHQKQKRRRKFIGIAAVIIVAIIAAVVIANQTIFKVQNDLNEARKYIEAGEIDKANEIIAEYENNEEVKQSEAYKYILAYEMYLDGDYVKAKDQFKEIPGYLNADEMVDVCSTIFHFNYKYKEGEKEKENMSMSEDSKFLDCSIILEKFKSKYPKYAGKFISENQEQWYNDAIDFQNELFTSRNVRADYKLYNNSKYYWDLINDNYKDASEYKEYVKIYTNSQYITKDEIDKCIANMELNPFAKATVFFNKQKWMVGTWKNADGSLWFNLDEDGFTQHNLPFFYYSGEKESYHIDSTGVYFIYDKGDSKGEKSTAVNTFQFKPRSTHEMDVYCYKDGNTYTLYKQ